MRIGIGKDCIGKDWRKSSGRRYGFDFTLNPSFEHAKAHLPLVKCFGAHGMIKNGAREGRRT